MALVTFSDLIHEIHGSLGKDSAFYYRRNASGKVSVCMKPGHRAPKPPTFTPEQIAEQKMKAATEAQKRRQQLFIRAQQITKEIMATTELKALYQERWRKQKKYPTLRGYVMAQVYVLIDMR